MRERETGEAPDNRGKSGEGTQITQSLPLHLQNAVERLAAAARGCWRQGLLPEIVCPPWSRPAHKDSEALGVTEMETSRAEYSRD